MIKLSWHTNCTTITMIKLSVSSIFSHCCGNCLLLPFDSFIILLNITTCVYHDHVNNIELNGGKGSRLVLGWVHHFMGVCLKAPTMGALILPIKSQ